jgi:hypothetical protein
MPVIESRFVAAIIACGLLGVVPAAAQQQELSPIRGTIESIDGPIITLKTRDGSAAMLHVPNDVRVWGMARIALSEVKPGSYVGSAAMPQQDGTQQALSVILFPEILRGTLEGSRPWDMRPNSTMINATVEQMVTANTDRRLSLKYKGGEKTIVVTPETEVVALLSGDKTELKPGAKVIGATTRNTDGSYDAPRFFVGRDGLTPPM